MNPSNKKSSFQPGSFAASLPKEEEIKEDEWTKLDLANAKLVALSPNIALYTNITEIYLQNNCITHLPSDFFSALVHLRVLDLSGNMISWLQPEISNLMQLRELNLNWNQIRELPVEMGKLFRLEKLSYEGNNVVKPAPEVLALGTTKMLSYFRDRMLAGEPPPARVWTKNTKSNKSNLQQEGIRVFCYNILAESYATMERLNYCPTWALAWDYRKHRLLSEMTAHDPDVICLQEVEAEQYSSYFFPQIANRGYQGLFHSKSRARTMDEYSSRNVDGCCIFWKDSLFQLVSEELIEYQSLALKKFEMVGQEGMNRLMTKDNIAIAVVLKPKGTLRINAAEADQIIVVNTHIHWDPACEDVKVMQVQMLTERLEQIEKSYRSPCGHPTPMVVCGDFNSVIDSAVYSLLGTKSVTGEHPDLKEYDYGHYSRHGLKHNLDLQSSYKTILGCEPAFTNYTGDFVGVLDYIWFTGNSLSVEQILATPSEEVVLSHNGALPNPYMCSDHVYLCADLCGKLKCGPDLAETDDGGDGFGEKESSHALGSRDQASGGKSGGASGVPYVQSHDSHGPSSGQGGGNSRASYNNSGNSSNNSPSNNNANSHGSNQNNQGHSNHSNKNQPKNQQSKGGKGAHSKKY